jgi:hypothetical protein
MKPSLVVELLREGAARYSQAHDLPVFSVDYARVVACAEHGKRMGAVYLAAPTVERSALPAYEAFRQETARQFDYLTRPVSAGGVGLVVQVSRVDPYTDADAMLRDIRDHGRLQVWATSECGNPHPFLTNTENDLFRAVHDAFGHGATGRGFDPGGEEAAWLKHSQMYTPLARRAVTTETRGQNSALVYYGDGRHFPRQKVCLLPPEFADPRSITVERYSP